MVRRQYKYEAVSIELERQFEMVFRVAELFEGKSMHDQMHCRRMIDKIKDETEDRKRGPNADEFWIHREDDGGEEEEEKGGEQEPQAESEAELSDVEPTAEVEAERLRERVAALEAQMQEHQEQQREALQAKDTHINELRRTLEQTLKDLREALHCVRQTTRPAEPVAAASAPPNANGVTFVINLNLDRLQVSWAAPAWRQPRVTLSGAHKAFIRDQVEPLRRLPPSDSQWQKLHQAFVVKFPTLERKPTLRQYKYEAVVIAARREEEMLRRVAAVGSHAGHRHGSRSQEDDTEEEVVAPPPVDDAFWRDSTAEDEEQRDGEEEEEEEETEVEEEEAEKEPDAEREAGATGGELTATEAEKLSERVVTLEAKLAVKEHEAQEWKRLFEATRVAGQELKRELFETKAALRAKDEQLSQQRARETEQKKALKDKDAQLLELQKMLMQAQQYVNEAQNAARLMMQSADSAPSQPPTTVQPPAPTPAVAPVASQPQTTANGVTLVFNLNLDRLPGPAP